MIGRRFQKGEGVNLVSTTRLHHFEGLIFMPFPRKFECVESLAMKDWEEASPRTHHFLPNQIGNVVPKAVVVFYDANESVRVFLRWGCRRVYLARCVRSLHFLARAGAGSFGGP